MKPWLIIDSNYLCHRTFHAFGGQTFVEEPAVLAFGFLRDVTNLQQEFTTDKIVFTFDAGLGKRRELLPSYKHSREDKHKDDTDEQREARKEFYQQIRKLRERYLRFLGYRNVFSQAGYEADDVIASITRFSLGEDDTAVIVSSDQDLWQLIDDRVVCYNPTSKVTTDRTGFVAKWGIEPCLWSSVKAIAGCGGDDVPGLRGIGEITAAKWVAGKLKQTSKAYRIISENLDVLNRNTPLVRLPFVGCDRFGLRSDAIDPKRWRELADKLGMEPIGGMVPGMPKGVKHRRGFGLCC